MKYKIKKYQFEYDIYDETEDAYYWDKVVTLKAEDIKYLAEQPIEVILSVKGLTEFSTRGLTHVDIFAIVKEND